MTTTFSLAIVRMQDLLSLPEKLRDAKWAHDVCTASRFVHVDVWVRSLDREYVRDTVLTVLRSSLEALQALVSDKRLVKENERNSLGNAVFALLCSALALFGLKVGKVLEKDTKALILEYIENEKLRIRNIEENYLKGKPSAFVPDDLISEPQKGVG